MYVQMLKAFVNKTLIKMSSMLYEICLNDEQLWLQISSHYVQSMFCKDVEWLILWTMNDNPTWP